MRIALVMLALVVAACTRPGGDTPLPTKEKTIGRVQQGLDQANQDAAKRREEAERAADPEGKPAKSISSGY